jgi:hypothetical protein
MIWNQMPAPGLNSFPLATTSGIHQRRARPSGKYNKCSTESQQYCIWLWWSVLKHHPICPLIYYGPPVGQCER